MKKLLLLLFFPTILFSQKLSNVQLQQRTHQYVVQQAWQLLKAEYPQIQYSAMASHVGSSETGGPFTTQKIVAGAYREDEEDLVYGNYGLAGALTTINHFWSADNGDNSTLYYFPFNRHNAYQKAMVFINGSDVGGNKRILIPESGWWPEVTREHTTGWYFSYESLFDLYTTGKYYWEGYIDDLGFSHYVQYGPFYFSQANRDKYVWEILGRAAHLLTDMGVPAHAHNDIHWPDTDAYEDAMTTSYAQNWNYIDAANQGGVIDVTNKQDPLRYLFYTTNQVADFFPSDDYSGDNNYNPNYGSDYYLELYDVISGLGSPPSSVNNSNIANASFVMCIRTVAGLLKWFADETGILLPQQALLAVTPEIINVGSGRSGTYIYESFQIQNTGNVTLNLTLQSSYWDIEFLGESSTHYFTKTLSPGQSYTVNYKSSFGRYEYGTFTRPVQIFDNSNNINKTHALIGERLLPDFCFAETAARSASPEEQLFDGAFIGYFGFDNDSLTFNKNKSIKERLDFAYKLLKKDKKDKVQDICKEVIELYPESEMGVSFYVMGLLWEAAYSEDITDFDEKDLKKYLKELTKNKDKYKIHGYAQLLLSLLDVGKDIEGLEKLFSDYEYDKLKELALFHQFIYYYIYEQDKIKAREISDKLDKMFEGSIYGYEIHLMFKDDGYTLQGLLDLIKKLQSSLLVKRADNKTDLLSELPTEYSLSQNYPNPFNPSTTIEYSIPKVSHIKICIYNTMGQLIKTLVDETKAPGFYNAEWNGTNENKSNVVSGIYFYRFESDDFISNNKMILLR